MQIGREVSMFIIFGVYDIINWLLAYFKNLNISGMMRYLKKVNSIFLLVQTFCLCLNSVIEMI